MKKMLIVNRWSGAVIWEGEAATMKDAVQAAFASDANLRDANLRGANLRDADLGGANLRDADLGGANLRGADLGGANLRDANLGGANLRGADLGGANLRGADLGGANLRDADLGGADLGGANLRDADLGGANLRGADLGGAKDVRLPTGELLTEYYEQVVPALLVSGGKSLESFKEHWECHSWDNCPIAHAFSVSDLDSVPVLLRPRAEQFVGLFDAQQIPWSVVQSAIEKTKGE